MAGHTWSCIGSGKRGIWASLLICTVPFLKVVWCFIFVILTMKPIQLSVTHETDITGSWMTCRLLVLLLFFSQSSACCQIFESLEFSWLSLCLGFNSLGYFCGSSDFCCSLINCWTGNTDVTDTHSHQCLWRNLSQFVVYHSVLVMWSNRAADPPCFYWRWIMCSFPAEFV